MTKRRPSPPATPGATPRACGGRTREGTPCTRAAGPSGLCSRHDPAAASARGRSGRRKQTERHRAARSETAARVAALGTATEIRTALETALAAVLESAADAVDKANVTARLASVALDVIGKLDLEREVAELRALIAERFPDAAERLGLPASPPPGGIH